MIGVTNLTGYDPTQTFQNLVTVATTSGTSSLYNATGSRLYYLDATSSFAVSASYEIIFEDSASHANFSDSGSYAGFARSASYAQTASVAYTSSVTVSSSFAQTASYIWPSGGSVLSTTIPTGSSAGAAGFASVAELGQFIFDTSASVVRLNDLIATLKLKGIIS